MLNLLLTNRSNQSTCGGPQERTRLARRKGLRTHESSVEEQRQLSWLFSTAKRFTGSPNRFIGWAAWLRRPPLLDEIPFLDNGKTI